MGSIDEPYYALATVEGSHWTTAQEKSVALDYPFHFQQESPEQFVTRIYLQFLWLPQVYIRPSIQDYLQLTCNQSIMPLQLLVPSLQRVTTLPSCSQSPHSLHPLLDPLLQTTRAVSNKYHVELVQILQDGCGAGDLEETMMWYALHHEKTGGNGSPKGADSGSQEPWLDEKWRQDWLDRLERRE